MWVEFKETFIGPLGQFIKGGLYDVPEAKLKQIGKSHYKETCAPWDKHKDNKAIAKGQAIEKANKAIAEAQLSQSRLSQCHRDTILAGELMTAAKKVMDRAQSNAKGCDKIIGNSKASAQNKATALAAIREHRHAVLRHELAVAEYNLTAAKMNLQELESKDARELATSLAKEAGFTWPEPEKAESKPEPPKDAAVADGSADNNDAETAV